MARLTRVQRQERTRVAVLAAARAEFAEYGYAAAKVDRIAERAELTRGAVYSNFPSKRALYLAVLADCSPAGQVPPSSPASVAAALGAFARVWLERLPLAGDSPEAGRLQLRSLSGVLTDEPGRAALAQAVRLEAVLLAVALESLPPRHTRRVRLAELVLTLLHGSAALAETAPGFGDPFDVAQACEHLAAIDLPDAWDPPHLAYVPPARPGGDAWAPPLTGLDADGVLVVLGAGRLAAAEEAVRAARPGDQVTVVVVTSDPAETGRLVRLRIDDLLASLRRVFAGFPALRVVHDDRALVATALGLAGAGDQTEAAVRIRDGKVVARAEGRGAAHAAATA